MGIRPYCSHRAAVPSTSDCAFSMEAAYSCKNSSTAPGLACKNSLRTMTQPIISVLSPPAILSHSSVMSNRVLAFSFCIRILVATGWGAIMIASGSLCHTVSSSLPSPTNRRVTSLSGSRPLPVST